MEAPKLPTVFKQIRSRGFNYQPVYYSEQKERAEEIKKKIAGKEVTLEKENFRSQLRVEMGRGTSRQTRSSNYRLLLIIGVLFALAYLIIIY